MLKWLFGRKKKPVEEKLPEPQENYEEEDDWEEEEEPQPTEPRTGPCQHYWEEYERIDVNDSSQSRVGYIIVLRCEHCGDLKNHQVGGK